jgi:hypothetical protein
MGKKPELLKYELCARMEVASGPSGVSSLGDAGSTERYVKVPHFSLT